MNRLLPIPLLCFLISCNTKELKYYAFDQDVIREKAKSLMSQESKENPLIELLGDPLINQAIDNADIDYIIKGDSIILPDGWHYLEPATKDSIRLKGKVMFMNDERIDWFGILSAYRVEKSQEELKGILLTKRRKFTELARIQRDKDQQEIKSNLELISSYKNRIEKGQVSNSLIKNIKIKSDFSGDNRVYDALLKLWITNETDRTIGSLIVLKGITRYKNHKDLGSVEDEFHVIANIPPHQSLFRLREPINSLTRELDLNKLDFEVVVESVTSEGEVFVREDIPELERSIQLVEMRNQELTQKVYPSF